MKESKEDIEKAILMVGKSLGGDEKVISLLLKNAGIISTIKELAYSAFIKNKPEYFEKDTEVFEAYQLLRKYCNELSINGEVKFKED